MGPSTSWSAPTYGIINQIAIGLNGTADWLNFSQDPFAGLDANRATDNFRYNFGFSPIYPQDFGLAFYKSNVFYAPFDPIRSVYVHTSLQANDPLVHYLVDDLSDWSVETNRVNVLSLPSNLGYINGRYAPWGGNPFHPDPALDLWVALKDPGVTRSDDWTFPTNQPLRIDWIGAVHRGTPWQTVYLKSTNLLLTAPQPSAVLNWARWTGNAVLRPDWFQPGCPVPDALFTTPTNDWHLVGLLNTFFNTNASHNLTSPNLATASTWEALLDGMTVFTNSGPGELTLVIISSNSPQAAFVAAGLLNSRASEPDQLFKTSGAVLATPELSVASPFLDPATFSRVTDAALEAIPSQLLGLLRSDSIASFETASGTNVIRFTGIDGNSYIIQTSADLINWSAVSTNSPENGVFDFSPDVSSLGRFYRSALGL
ncbi:MAG TPA: hypothetical protein VL793_15405, partial [Patescibacteria group bacterium]|nr:hypothetical protein [Patescibacteria group bacterium]